MMARAASGLLALALLLVGAVHAQEVAEPAGSGGVYIAAIRFEGNKRTQEHILLQEMDLRAGDTVAPDRIEAARQAIMDLGLFKSVAVSTESAEQGVVLVFTIEEKFFLLPVPLLNGDPNSGDYSYGMELRVDNLGGLNQRIKLKYEQEHSPNSDDVPFNREGSISYNYPRVLGTAYNLGLSYKLKQEDLNVFDAEGAKLAEYHRNISSVNGDVSRWFNLTGPSRGWFGGLGLGYQQHEYNFLAGTPGEFETTQAVSVGARVGTNEVHDHGTYLTGAAYGWEGSVGSKWFGSDYDYTRHLFYYRVYNHFESAANLNWQLRLGFADGKPFDSFAYSIGGFSTLRGYQDSIKGNALALSNLEYHQQLDNWPTVRGVLFLDLGNAYETVGDMEPGDLEAGTGFGVRWRIQSLVDVTLSADLAYGIGTQEPVFYLMTTGTF